MTPRGASIDATQLRAAAEAIDAAQRTLDAATTARNKLIQRALADGWTQRAIADATGLSAGRLGQLAKELGRSERRFVPHSAGT